MDRYAAWKWILLICLVAFSLVLVVPWKERVKYGLDIRGGSSFVVAIEESAVREEVRRRGGHEWSEEQLEAEVRKIMRDVQPRALEVIRNRVDELGTQEPLIYAEKGNNRIVVQLPGIRDEQRREAEEVIGRVAFLAFHVVHKQNDELVRKLMDERIPLDGFRIVEDRDGKAYYVRDTQARKPEEKKTSVDPMLRFPVGKAPIGYVFLLQRVHPTETGEERFVPICVKRLSEMTGEYITDAHVEITPTGSRHVSLEFDSKGAKIFSRITTDYGPNGEKNRDPVGAQLAVVLDGTVYSAPVIREPIHGGRAQITGHFPGDEAYTLALVLRTGSMPAPITIVERRHVDPTLGRDAVTSGIRAVLVGGVAVLLFMVGYYGMAGFVANLALILNLVLLPLGMVVTAGFLSLGLGPGAKLSGLLPTLPVLTLPGIAGIGLTLGMAVDANILIFERIREEFRIGKRFWSAIAGGYERAFSAIVDSNLTTVLTGIILFIFGSGPVRGFAVTTTAGILISLYTAVVVTRMVFALVARHPHPSPLRMREWLPSTTHFDFLSKARLAMISSAVVIFVSGVVFAVRAWRDPSAVLSVDFTSGVAVTFACGATSPEHRPSVAAIRKTLEAAGIRGVRVDYQRDIDAPEREHVQIKASYNPRQTDQTQVIARLLAETFPRANFAMAQQQEVSPLIGAEIVRRALWAICLGLVGIILYLWIRFELGFGIGAVVAILHDVLVTTGIYSLLGFQLSGTLLAALLLIIGYSVNDTIVVFDRIRQNLKTERGKSFSEICNLSVNQSLSRTLLTSLTTLFVALALLLVGGGAIRELAAPLCIGIVVGTYSTIYIATPVMLAWYRHRRPDLSGHRPA